MTTREVVLDGGSPWGFRMHGGVDVQQPLRISRVNPGSKAALKGVREGDLITSINGKSTKDITNAEAHSLLKNAGNTLKLGLNEDCSGSPKRRQYKSVHQETHSEIIKRSSITSSTTYTVNSSTTNIQNPSNLDNERNSRHNGNHKAEGSARNSRENKIISQRSTLSSNSTVSSPNTSFQESEGAAELCGQQKITSNNYNTVNNNSVTVTSSHCDIAIMADNVIENSRSRKKRSRSGRKKTKKLNKNEATSDAVVEQVCDDDKEVKTITESKITTEQVEYRVESPVKDTATKKITNTRKSKSLDDDEALKITELSSGQASEDDDTNKNVSNAIVAEADSEVEWETVEELGTGQPLIIMPADDEVNLRNFLEGLNLVNSPQESSKRVYDKTENIIKSKRAKKRAALAQYFLPVYENPRYLDVISEEGSDLSDKEQKTKNNQVLLVGTKIIEATDMAEGICSTSVTERSSGAEIVFLEDSSNSNSDSEDNLNNLIPSSQLTPPPTPDEETTINKEVGSICEEVLQEPREYSNAISPPISLRSPSISSNGSSSRGTSLCTARYNPLSSSLTDIASIIKDEDYCNLLRPLTLRELCLKAITSLPFGADMLQELADVSLRIERLPEQILSTIKLNNNETCNIPVDMQEKIADDVDDTKWVGIRVEDEPVVLCLSPKQKEELENTKQIPHEAEKLLDLHDKYLNRRGYFENPSKLLAIIRDSCETTDACKTVDNENMYLYYVGKDDESERKKFTRSISATLPRETEICKDARLKARDLSEWLQLARFKSTSDSNLNVIGRQQPEIPTENLSFHLNCKRRTSLPQELYERQMRYILEKEMEIQREMEQLEEEKRKLAEEREFEPDKYYISRKGDIAIRNENLTTYKKPRPRSMPMAPTEFFRQQMYEEYMKKIIAREERKQHKVIKLSTRPSKTNDSYSERNSLCEVTHISGIEDEFMNKVKERMGKLGIEREESDDLVSSFDEDDGSEPVLVMDGDSLTDSKKLPKHLREFLDITKNAVEDESAFDGVWSPGQSRQNSVEEVVKKNSERKEEKRDEPVQPVWTPKSAGSSPILERKEFRPVNFESPVLSRKNKHTKFADPLTPESSSTEPPWKVPETSSDVGVILSSSLEKRLPTSHSAPASGFSDFSASRLPRAQNPTITLLQKAREGRFSRGAAYVEQEEQTQSFRKNKHDRAPVVEPGEILYQIKNEYTTSESDSERPKKMADLGPRKFEGIGPTTRDGMPMILRSEVKESNQSKWYKRMYDTIHKQRNDDEYVTVRYKQRRARYPYSSGYLSEPEPGAYDSDALSTDYKYATLDRRRLQPSRDKENEYLSSTMPRGVTNRYTTSSEIIRHGQDVYKNQPGRIENYVPGHSSISEKEAKEWWDEVMDIFDGWLDDHSALPSYNYMLSKAIARSHLEQQKHVPPQTRSYMSQALKESGYESDSTLIFRRRDDTAQKLSPQEQKEVYKSIQKGGDVPLHGLRKPAPERPKDDAEIEYIPISPTLTRIRVHKSIKPQTEIICYPVTTVHSPNVFAKYKRTAPSSTPALPKPPPSPPRRRSSRNNSTLRLISTMKLRTDKLPSCRRHETCFTTTSNVDKDKVKYLRDKITCKLSPVTNKKRATDSKARIKVTKTVSASPNLKSKVTSTLTTTKDPKTSANKVISKTNISTKQISSLKRPNKPGTLNISKKPDVKAKGRSTSLERTFGSEKHKVDLTLPKLPTDKRFKLVRSPELLSPKEVKKAVLSQIVESPGVVYKKSASLYSSVKNGMKTQTKEKTLPIKIGITERGKEILKTSGPFRSLPSTPIASRNLRIRNSSTSPSLSEKSKTSKSNTSLESIKSPKLTKREITKIKPNVSSESKKINKKSKKDQLNGEIARKEKKTKPKEKKENTNSKGKKCAGRAAGTEIVKKLRKIQDEDEFGSSSTLNEIQRQKELVQTDSFYQHLFLRDMPSPTPSNTSRSSSWVTEKTIMLQRKRSSFSEPSIGAIKVYLNHTKPVTDSKFRSLDAAVMRSRSVSPKSVRWQIEQKAPKEVSSYHEKERSSSLPPKLVFTETSRPVSPVGRRYVRSPTPPPLKRSSTPPQLKRSPSRRRIMHLKNLSQPIETFYNFKTKDALAICPSHLTRSTSSIDSCDRSDYQNYVKELVYSSRKSSRFKELNNFYLQLERMGELERATSSTELRPRRKSEDEIIDYDRWKEVRTRERAEKELKGLYAQLKDHQKEKDFLFRSKDVEAFRWKREYDRGLRIKEKSVENIKDNFEKLKIEESELEAAKKRELQYQKDTYKPLWRGSSVLNLASAMVEKRSLSEGREPLSKRLSDRFQTHGIGSHVWSSLSVEQVNSLREQLSEIYNNHHAPKNFNHQDHSVNVPLEKKLPQHPLSVRRNSDTTERIPKSSKQQAITVKAVPTISSGVISENDKKLLSQTLSKEILDRASKQQKYKTSLSLVLGKETRGAIAAAEANVKTNLSELASPRTCYSLEMSEDGSPEKQKHKDSDFVLVLAKNETQQNQVKEKLQEWAQPKKALVTTDATSSTKISSTSETESGSTDDSFKTVVYLGNKDEVQKKVEYFEQAAAVDTFTPTIYHPAESSYDIGEIKDILEQPPKKLTTSQSYQNLKELYGEKELMKFTTLPLSASRREICAASTKPQLRTTDISPLRTESLTTSTDSIYRSRSLSPCLWDGKSIPKVGKVRKLKNKFEYLEDFYSHRLVMKPRRWRSDPQLNKTQMIVPARSFGDVDALRRKYEYPAIAGRGRSRTRRGGVVSPIFLRAEDRFMPHINIISKIASLYPRRSASKESLDKHRSTEELAQILGCPLGEVQKLRERFDSPDSMSLLGHMFTSSPNLHELRDISPYLAASWIAHRYPRSEDNTRSLSSPEQYISRDNSLLRRDRPRPKSASPPRPRKPLSILKTQQRPRPEGTFTNQNFDPTIHRPICRYQPPQPRIEPVRYRSWWPPMPTHNRPSVTFKEPEGPIPPPKGRRIIRNLEPESPRKYVENEVTIHYRTPVRQEIKESLSEEELARRQAEAMKKIYQEERRRKYLQELQDMNSRRHTDNFIPSQKSPIPLNRYDDFIDDLSPKMKPRPRSPEPRLVAKALYNFVGQSARELTFRKGDIIYIRRQVDRNWYEGEHNAMIGLFPVNYVEIIPYEGIKATPRKAYEGQARAKYNFIAQTHLELSLAKGELVVITRKVDDNWYEGKIGGRKGIFPVSYVEVLIDPNDLPPVLTNSKPVASPAAHSLLLNGSAGGKESMGSHSYTPSFPNPQLTSSYHAKPVQTTGNGSYGSLSRPGRSPVNQTLHIDTQSEPIPYRALYKYRPQNDDELELLEGDTVYVLEKCDDGWYVGSSDRTGAFGTFPGNYVEQI